MSAYLCSCDTLSALATYWSEHINEDRFRDHHRKLTCAICDSGPSTPYRDAQITAERLLKGRSAGLVVFELLLAENQASLEARYPDDPEMRDASHYRFSVDPDVKRAVQFGLPTGAIVGLVDGYEYQSCEHHGWRRSIGRALCLQIREMLNEDLQRRDGALDLWASYERGEWPKATTPCTPVL